MIHKLTEDQVVDFWDVIKHTHIQSSDYPGQPDSVTLNGLLHNLLSGTAQCFVSVIDNKIYGVMLTKLVNDTMKGENEIEIIGLYMYEQLTNDQMRNTMRELVNLAKNLKCRHVSFRSSNQKVWRLGESVGFKEEQRIYGMEI